MTFAQMVERVRLTLGMNETISNDESILIKAWLNEGVLDVLVRTRPNSRVINLTVQPNTPEHDMSGTIISLADIVLPGHGKVDRLTRADIFDAQAVGAVAYAYEEPLFWFSPVVSTPTVIKAYGTFKPNPMAADGDSPAGSDFGGLNDEFHPAVLNYALWQGGSYVQHEGSGEGEKWRILYEGQDGNGGNISQIKKILAKRVTPQYARRQRLTRNLGALSRNEEWVGG